MICQTNKSGNFVCLERFITSTETIFLAATPDY